MARVCAERMTARLVGDEPDGGFVVFVLGMRVNRWWTVHRWLPVFLTMAPMLRQLLTHPELGLLGMRTLVGSRGPTVVQYWRSSEHLLRFARDASSPHLGAWRRFNRRIASSGDVGVWHETYVVPPGGYEAVYVNMPRYGLAAAGEHLPVRARGERAGDRLAAG
ncbi:MAG TPA: DUF4188 domain-containing protein [Mycobacteriales bacterium]|jgi:hypothetical protein